MVGWHHQLNGHEFEQAVRDDEGQRGLVCCSPRGQKMALMVKNLPAMQETLVRFLGWEDPLEKG